MNHLESPVFIERVEFLNNTQFWPKEKLYDLQLKKLSYLVKYVSENILFYQEFLNKHHLTWKDFKKVEDVKKFPLLTKTFLQENYDKFLPFNVDKNKLLHRTTGGSTGKPLTVYIDLDFYARDSANTQHYMQVFDLDIFNYKSVRLYGDKISASFLKNRIYWYEIGKRKLIMSCYHINKDTAKSYICKINDFNPTYIHTRPSSVWLLANYIISGKLVLKKPIRYIFCDGEYLTNGQRKKIEAAFQTRVISIYGHTEGCIIGYACKKSNNLHFMPQIGILELLDSEGNEVLDEGEKGEMVTTGFNNFIFPLIRYRTQDIGVLGNQECTCGRNYKILSSVEGRVQDYVVDKDDRLVPLAPAIFNYNDMDWKGIKEFKVYQKSKGVLILKMLPEKNNLDKLSKIKKIIQKKIEEIFGLGFKIKVEFVKELRKTKIGKYRYLEQKLDISKYFD